MGAIPIDKLNQLLSDETLDNPHAHQRTPPIPPLGQTEDTTMAMRGGRNAGQIKAVLLPDGGSPNTTVALLKKCGEMPFQESF